MQLALIPRELSPAAVRHALLPRRGRANGITAEALAGQITGRCSTADQRRLRQIVEHLREQGEPICAHPAHGYYWAVNAADLDATCAYLYGRALTSLRQICAMKRIAMPDLRGQLGLPLEPDNG